MCDKKSRQSLQVTQ